MEQFRQRGVLIASTAAKETVPMRKLAVLIAAIAAFAAVAVPALAATRSIKVGDDYFVKAGTKPTVTVKNGTTVRWSFVGKSPHNVTVTSGPVKFKSKTTARGSYSRKVTRAGTYRIVCTVHSGQSMTLRVRR